MNDRIEINVYKDNEVVQTQLLKIGDNCKSDWSGFYLEVAGDICMIGYEFFSTVVIIPKEGD